MKFEEYFSQLVDSRLEFVYTLNHIDSEPLHLVRQFFRDNREIFSKHGRYDREKISTLLKNTCPELEEYTIKCIVMPLKKI